LSGELARLGIGMETTGFTEVGGPVLGIGSGSGDNASLG